MPDGYSQIFRLYVFGPSGFWTMALLHYSAKLIAPGWRARGRNPRKGRDQILPSGNLDGNRGKGQNGIGGERERERERRRKRDRERKRERQTDTYTHTHTSHRERKRGMC